MANCPDRFRYMLVKLGLKSGSVCRALSTQEKDFAQWLINGVPPKETLAGHLITIAKQKYKDELAL